MPACLPSCLPSWHGLCVCICVCVSASLYVGKGLSSNFMTRPGNDVLTAYGEIHYYVITAYGEIHYYVLTAYGKIYQWLKCTHCSWT